MILRRPLISGGKGKLLGLLLLKVVAMHLPNSFAEADIQEALGRYATTTESPEGD
jgi:hypothetical protein